MQHGNAHPSLWQRATVCGLLLFSATVVAAQGSGPTPQETGDPYQRDVQACRAGSSGQDLATCLKEARHARAARLRGDLDTDTSSLQANRVRRCAVFDGEERAACLARMAGRGTTSGSVSGGGLLREVETVVLPADSGPVPIKPRTQDPVFLVPAQR
jgi:hypothetical protein